MDTQTTTKKQVNSLGELEIEARALLESLLHTRRTNSELKETKALLVTLSGELGAGKTTFTQFVAKALGVKDTVNSPTFVIEKIYSTSSEEFTRFVHIDAYRLEKMQDLQGIGFDELMRNPKTLILFEWPERIEGIFEIADVKITLEPLADESRVITYA